MHASISKCHLPIYSQPTVHRAFKQGPSQALSGSGSTRRDETRPMAATNAQSGQIKEMKSSIHHIHGHKPIKPFELILTNLNEHRLSNRDLGLLYGNRTMHI